MCCRNFNQGIVPPYIIEHLAQSENPEVRAEAVAQLSADAALRALRHSDPMPDLTAMAAPNRQRFRCVYNARNTALPGMLVREENQEDVADEAVNEAYHFSGDVYDFYEQVFGRSSLDDNGMALISSVHVTSQDNAFWNGKQVAYADSNGLIFQRFTRSLDVIGHEFTHGVQQFTSNLRYYGQSGALNEHFADVFGILIRQWKNRETVGNANWLIGSEILVPAEAPIIRRGIRDMKNPGTAYDDPAIGRDPQPAHMDQIYEGTGDYGGVHINSGIPNRAFVLTAQALGGNAWDVAGRIWYRTMLALPRDSQFADCARRTVQVAAAYGQDAETAAAESWATVGIDL